jgi:hypothetical protein
VALDPASFRAIFPEFADAATYPDARLTFVINEASLRLLPTVWGDLLDTGVAYYAAHRLALAGTIRPGVNGGAASVVAPTLGLVTSKSVGPVSKSVDVSTGSVDGAGEYNLTVYGREFAQLAASVTVGAMQF